jgi:hypothetical protein
MQEPVVVSLNEEALTERIVQAGVRVCLVSPRLYDWVAEALVEVAGRIGCERIYVVVDPDPFVIQVGYGTEETIRKVCASVCPSVGRSGFGLIITDDRAESFRRYR